MLQEKGHNCAKLNECVKNPGKVYCNIACPDTTTNCFESFKVFNPPYYAKVSIPEQVYQNLFDIDSAFIAGTIFKDLYSPYSTVQFLEV